MVVATALSELMIVLFLLFVALIPGAIIYFDAGRKGRNKYFWSLSVITGLMTGVVPGLIVVLIYLLYPNHGLRLKESNQGKRESKSSEKTGLPDLELERTLEVLNENEKKVIEVLMTVNSITQSEIARKTGLSTPTVSRILGKLESRGIVIRYRDGMSKRVKLNSDLFNHRGG